MLIVKLKNPWLSFHIWINKLQWVKICTLWPWTTTGPPPEAYPPVHSHVHWSVYGIFVEYDYTHAQAGCQYWIIRHLRQFPLKTCLPIWSKLISSAVRKCLKCLMKLYLLARRVGGIFVRRAITDEKKRNRIVHPLLISFSAVRMLNIAILLGCDNGSRPSDIKRVGLTNRSSEWPTLTKSVCLTNFTCAS